MIILLSLATPKAAFAHPPVPLNGLSAREHISDLSLAIKLQEKRMKRLFQLDGNTAEQILSEAQTVLFKGNPERAIKQLWALTISPAFPAHPARAAIYHWLGIGFQSMGFPKASMTYLLKAFREPKQTDAHRAEILRALFELRMPLENNLAMQIWQMRQTSSTPLFDNMRWYPLCRALYDDAQIEIAKACFNKPHKHGYDQARASYFLGVLELRARRYTKAEKFFKTTQKLARAQRRQSRSTHVETKRQNQVTHIAEYEITSPSDDKWSDLEIRVGLALARLAAGQEQWRKANLYYRQVPPGHPTFYEASREWALVLDKLNRPNRAAGVLGGLGQSVKLDADGLKQQMWRAELLGRSESYTQSLHTYAHVDKHTRQMENDLLETGDTRVDDVRRATWLAPTLGEVYEMSVSELGKSEIALDALLNTITALSKKNHAQLLHDTQRARDIQELSHRLEDIDAGLPIALKRRHSKKLRTLSDRIEQLKQQNHILEKHYQALLPNVLDDINELARSCSRGLDISRHVRRQTDKALFTATQSLLQALGTQAGLGPLNLHVWKKEAVSNERRRIILEKQALTNWIESADPSHRPEVRH